MVSVSQATPRRLERASSQLARQLDSVLQSDKVFVKVVKKCCAPCLHKCARCAHPYRTVLLRRAKMLPRCFLLQIVRQRLQAAFGDEAVVPLMSVTRVSMTKDLQIAQGWISVLGERQVQDKALEVIQGCIRFVLEAKRRNVKFCSMHCRTLHVGDCLHGMFLRV